MSESFEPNNLKDVLFLIPARAGSKAVPRKNLQVINGKTLVEISIKQALNVGLPNNIYVSSDSIEILKYADDFNVKSTLRTLEESSDIADANMVVKHFISNQKIEDSSNASIVYLQPTSPFRDADLIMQCIDLHKQLNVPVVTVRKVVDHPEKMITLSNGKIENYLQEFNPTGNRQELEDVFIPSGSVYVFSIEHFLMNDSRIPIIGAFPVEVFDEKIIDINTEYDLLLAQNIGEKFEF